MNFFRDTIVRVDYVSSLRHLYDLQRINRLTKLCGITENSSIEDICRESERVHKLQNSLSHDVLHTDDRDVPNNCSFNAVAHVLHANGKNVPPLVRWVTNHSILRNFYLWGEQVSLDVLASMLDHLCLKVLLVESDVSKENHMLIGFQNTGLHPHGIIYRTGSSLDVGHYEYMPLNVREVLGEDYLYSD